MMMNIDCVKRENERRNEALQRPYDPETGVGCCGKRAVTEHGGRALYLPVTMLADPDFAKATGDVSWVKLRCRHDFEFWAWKCVVIQDKTTGKDIPFVLNAPQRRVLATLEADRLARRPIRLIMLKARQWGGSTLIQMYMAWIQTVLHRNWNSLICAHFKDTSGTILGMYDKLLANYPPDYWDGDKEPGFRPYQRSTNIRTIEGRGCRVTLASSESQDAVRGGNFAMAHLSEVAYFKDSPKASPEQFIRAICGGINYTPLTLIALESTANGIGNYFHREWLRAKSGGSDKHAIFVPWHEIEIYRLPVDDVEALWQSLDDYERRLWDEGLTLEMIHWYHRKRQEYQTAEQMRAEYPGTDLEAFLTVEQNVFAGSDVERLRERCIPPAATGEMAASGVVGEAALDNLHFVPSVKGGLKIWRPPADDGDSQRYVAAVDVGGRSAKSDWSVILVMDRRGGDDGCTPEVVAQWRGHADHDILAWKAVQIARHYNNALLVFESNTLESEATDGDHALYILQQVKNKYPRLYHRSADDGNGRRIGFHTNRATKSLVINRLITAVRDAGYIERDEGAINELLVYQVDSSGHFAAMPGNHDDRLITRAIALHVISRLPSPAADASLERYLERFNI